MFISFEGIDGSGKSTQVKLFVEYLKNSNYHYLLIREPGGTKAGEDIRKILLHLDYRLFPQTELLLFMASRSQIVREIILPALKCGTVVIADRFLDSSVAYQGYGRELGVETVRSLNRLATGNLKPDLTFLIDISPEDAEKRKRAQEKNDKIERESLDFFKRVREGYLKIAKAEPERVKVINGNDDPELIHTNIVKIFEQHMKERTGKWR
ncbi:thymidylate kinase [Kosmotoga arenicorallina S304]|uniref:Thymidylate kinase n=1 Tax=Kosmotoga arenicorallina S304 TaxID=1453497 RepID=A0A176K0H4_9BACT|nr:dTMP kinase [Kosmotoga arenicorallina]OAA29749.1 thymidylate kinase [Kosmotoga arenicorallina S304]